MYGVIATSERAEKPSQHLKRTETLENREIHQVCDIFLKNKGHYICAKPMFGAPSLILGFRKFLLEICREDYAFGSLQCLGRPQGCKIQPPWGARVAPVLRPLPPESLGSPHKTRTKPI
jgi:hypothetical protein